MTERDLPENIGLPDKSLELIKQPNEIKEDKLGGIDDSSMEAVDVLVARSSGVDTAQEIERIEQDIDNEADNFYKETIIPFPENIPKEAEPKKTFWERLNDTRTVKRAKAWVAAGIAAFSLSPIAASASSNETLTPPTVMVTPGEMESQNAGEVTPDPTMITNEYRQQTVAEIMNFEGPEPTPMPTEKVKNIFEDWKEQTFGPYAQELKNLGAENESRIKFGSRMLYAYDNSEGLAGWDDGKDKFQDHIIRQDIIDYVLTGESDDVFFDESGNQIWIITSDKKADKRIKKAFRAAIDWFSNNGAPDALESICNNGFCILFSTVAQENATSASALLTEHGIIAPNMDSQNISDVNDKSLMNTFIRNLPVESYGIAYLQITTALEMTNLDRLANVEVIKPIISGAVDSSLSDHNDLYGIFARGSFGTAEDKSRTYRLPMDSPGVVRQLQLLLDFIDPIGFGNLRDVPEMSQYTQS